jgi:hypothetical protein
MLWNAPRRLELEQKRDNYGNGKSDQGSNCRGHRILKPRMVAPNVELKHQKADNIQERKPACICFRYAQETPGFILLVSFGLCVHGIEINLLIRPKATPRFQTTARSQLSACRHIQKARTANIRQAIAIRFHGGENKTGGDSCMPIPLVVHCAILIWRSILLTPIGDKSARPGNFPPVPCVSSVANAFERPSSIEI